MSEPWFSVPVESLPSLAFEHTPFDRLHVFSMSGYLRSLGVDVIDLEMPRTFDRLAKLPSLLTTVL